MKMLKYNIQYTTNGYNNNNNNNIQYTMHTIYNEYNYNGFQNNNNNNDIQ